jgi:glycosyltransferase involved in cell wall biosynthesis
MTTDKSVSVVIAAWNSQDTLARAIESALIQTLPVLEVIVIDDGSTDATAAIAFSYSDSRMRVLRRVTNQGVAAARNAGIRMASGTWIAFLDADDVWHPTKLERQMAFADADASVSFVFCGSREYSSSGETLGDTFRGWPITSGLEAWKALLAHNVVATPTVVARRELLIAVGEFNESMKIAEDQDMWIRLALAGPVLYVPEYLVDVYEQVGGLSRWTVSDQKLYTLAMVEEHLTQLGEKLTSSERRLIRGTRWRKTAQNAFAHGEFRYGIEMLWRSAMLGYRPVSCIAAMPLMVLKHVLDGSRRDPTVVA